MDYIFMPRAFRRLQILNLKDLPMRFFIGLSMIFVALLAGCGGAGTTTTATTGTGTTTTTNQQVVGVSGNHMTLNGKTWLPRGVVLQGFVQPIAMLEASGNNPQILKARQNFGTTELNAISAFGADTIRFQISQPSLDPANSLYDPNYLSDVENAIEYARQSGFVVMIMMQDETITGDASQNPLPTAETQSDWDLFNTEFGKDSGVIFELYNEPSPTETTAHWTTWLNGGALDGNTSVTYVGMQTLINHLRANGSENVFVLDGLDYAKTLNGVPAVTDPLSEVVYAVHPYPDGSADESQWAPDFGVASQTLPVWADEWSAATGQAIGLGSLPNYQVAVDFLNYLQANSIPLCAGAFDIPRFMVQSLNPWVYTNYDNFSPSSTVNDAGELVHNLYITDYSRQLTDADGL